jgi:NAD-dependent deacetylase
MKKLVVLSGAGISAESGLATFRDMGGIWEKYDVTEVASPEAWNSNPELVLRFYNERRKKLYEVEPNLGHHVLAELEQYFNIQIITQNVDDLHERAGSTNILHLHGELKKARSTANPSLVHEIEGPELNFGDVCELGAQLRPHIVWFGEMVEYISEARQIVSQADLFLVVGTSLNVYPAAGLMHFIPTGIPVYVIDPANINLIENQNFSFLKEKASVGLMAIKEILIGQA